MEVDKLDVDKPVELEVDKLKPIPINFKKISGVADNDVVWNNVIWWID